MSFAFRQHLKRLREMIDADLQKSDQADRCLRLNLLIDLIEEQVIHEGIGHSAGEVRRHLPDLADNQGLAEKSK